MTNAEKMLLAEVAWKENRRGQIPGMTSIINVVQNRVKKHGASIESIIMAPFQFTSMSVKSDPEYGIDPAKSTGIDAIAWDVAQELAFDASAGTLNDLTNGATLYYAPNSIRTHKNITLPNGEVVPFPLTWNPKAVKYAATIAGQIFFTSV
jgi:spore germination cell wall hydrolase CwlJ-like protein